MDPAVRKLSFSWWIGGPTKDVKLLMPPSLKGHGLGCIYALELKSGKTKIGSTHTPHNRISDLVGEFKNYSRDPVKTISLSLPTSDYLEIEWKLHEQLEHRRSTGELSNCGLDAITSALLIAFSGVSVKPIRIPASQRKRAGRPPKPWFRADRLQWHVYLNGRRHRLGYTTEEADQNFAALMAAHGRAT
jgi:hypothetical protein